MIDELIPQMPAEIRTLRRSVCVVGTASVTRSAPIMPTLNIALRVASGNEVVFRGGPSSRYLPTAIHGYFRGLSSRSNEGCEKLMSTATRSN